MLDTFSSIIEQKRGKALRNMQKLYIPRVFLENLFQVLYIEVHRVLEATKTVREGLSFSVTLQPLYQLVIKND